jgi:hypothetical protein
MLGAADMSYIQSAGVVKEKKEPVNYPFFTVAGPVVSGGGGALHSACPWRVQTTFLTSSVMGVLESE